jgi:hypothetical protein
MIMRREKLIFVHIQKTGGSAIADALGQEQNPPEKHFRAQELRALYGEDVWRSSYRFAFVRNPWARLVSWWAMIDARRPNLANANAFMRFILTRAATFEEFIENCDEDIADTDGHKWIYRNQLEYLTDTNGGLMVDFIGRFEHLQRDFDVVTERVFQRRIPLALVNASHHARYTNYYSDRMAEKVAARYAADIAAFGYSFGD